MKKFYFMVATKVLVTHTGRYVYPKMVVVQYGETAEDAQARMIPASTVAGVIAEITGLTCKDYTVIEWSATHIHAPETRRFLVPVEPAYNVGTLHIKA